MILETIFFCAFVLGVLDCEDNEIYIVESVFDFPTLCVNGIACSSHSNYTTTDRIWLLENKISSLWHEIRHIQCQCNWHRE